MDFVLFTVPKDVFPRFDNASSKSLDLQSRYNAMLRQLKSLREDKYFKLYLCRKSGEIDFPVEIGSCIAETVRTRKFDQGKIIKSRNIKSFLRTQEESDSYITVLVAGIRAKREIDKLGPTKFHFVLVAEDANIKADFKEEYVRHDKSIIIVANKETVSREIDNLLERISLAPLKAIAENCYEKFQRNMGDTSSTMKSSNVSQIGKMAKTLEHRNGLTYAEYNASERNGLQNTKSSDLYPSSIGHVLKTKEKHEIFLRPRKNGSAVSSTSNQCLRAGTAKAGTGIYETNSTKTIYTRSKSSHVPGSLLNGTSERNGFEDTASFTSEINGLKGRVYSTSEGKGIKRFARHESVELDPLSKQKGKRRKNGFEGSYQIGLLGREYQSSSSDDIKEEENPERLLEAILAVYGMSNVPEAERPKVPKQSCKVSKEMRNELFKICPTIKRLGYRYRTFYIYAVQPKNETDEASRRYKICSVLKRYGIHNFKIAPCANVVTELMHVGAEIEARPASAYSLRSGRKCGPEAAKGGTLGCFVNMNNGEGQCGLLSKHVTLDCSDVYFVDKGNKREIGHMLEETNRHQDRGLDISAAFISEHIDANGKKFKDRRQNLLKGQLHEYNEDGDDAICRSGQPVHIFGAKSNPGKGEITMPCVEIGLSTALIQVEDQISDSRTVKEHFAESGDSGAIVCVEDPAGEKVHALSMVMGTDLKETARRKYLTIPLSKGLQQLEENTGKTFTLC